VEEAAAREPVVVTVWLEVPVLHTMQGLVINEEVPDGFRVWYTKEDTVVQHTCGDGVNIHRLKF